MQPLHAQNQATFKKNIARIAKPCPENITLVFKCVKLHFPKVLRKFQKKGHKIFLGRGFVIFFTSVTTVTTVFFFYFLSTFGKSNLTHLTTDVMFSGQPFAMVAMFFSGPPPNLTKSQALFKLNCPPPPNFLRTKILKGQGQSQIRGGGANKK